MKERDTRLSTIHGFIRSHVDTFVDDALVLIEVGSADEFSPQM